MELCPFFDASMGQAFLNNPHTRFTENLAQTEQNAPDLSVIMTGNYNSAFQDSSTGKNKGCDGYHDVTTFENLFHLEGTSLSVTDMTQRFSEVPKPTTILLLVSGLIGLAAYGRKKFFKK